MEKILWLGEVPNFLKELRGVESLFQFQHDRGAIEKWPQKTRFAFYSRHWSEEQMKSLYYFGPSKNHPCWVFCDSLDAYAEVLPLLIERGVTVFQQSEKSNWPRLFQRWASEQEDFRSRAEGRETQVLQPNELLQILDFSVHGLKAEAPLCLENLEILSKNIVRIRRENIEFFVKIRWAQLKIEKMVLGFQILATQET